MLIYKNAKILTMGDAGIIEDGIVLVDENKIIKVCAAADVQQASYDGKIIDLNSMVLMPGLINAHHHCAMWKNYGKVTDFTHDSFTQAYMAARSSLVALKKGVLAVRDLGHKGDGHMQLKG